MKCLDYDESKKSMIKKTNHKDESDDQLKRYRITEEQQQKEDAQQQFEEKYKEKTKQKPKTQKKDVKETKTEKTQKDSPKKARGKKRFFSFFKELRTRSVWKKIVFNLRNLFKTQTQLEEEELIIDDIKKSKLKSLLGLRKKEQEKQLTVRIAYLLQELRELNQQIKNLTTIKKMLEHSNKLVTLTNSYIKSVAENKNIAHDHVKAKVAETHSTVTNIAKKQELGKITQNQPKPEINLPNNNSLLRPTVQIHPHIMQTQQLNQISYQNVGNPLLTVLSFIHTQAVNALNKIGNNINAGVQNIIVKIATNNIPNKNVSEHTDKVGIDIRIRTEVRINFELDFPRSKLSNITKTGPKETINLLFSSY
ncbi:MAG: hypothetical protein HRK26_01480 [Rickettsiaceae bacterium H1]|nr:hypothetical protein [Rickettsiaceae bacterium H1]